MNRENVLKVADAIENHTIEGLGFNMGSFCAIADRDYSDQSGHGCGTVACIAGTAVFVELGEFNGPLTFAEFFEPARDFLGLNEADAQELFYRLSENDGLDKLLISTTTQEAVDVLRYLAATGKVDWHWAENDPSFGVEPEGLSH